MHKYSSLVSDVDPACKQTISEIADLSILPNVGGSAKEILAFMDDVHHD